MRLLSAFRVGLVIIGGVAITWPVAVFADGAASGTASGNAVLQRFGTKENLNQNVSVPMTHSATPMQTVDGTKSFAVTTNMPSSNSFLQIMIQPVSTGDLGTVIVAQDLDANGAFDNTFTLGVPVSGVCANGFISCSPGTWNNCQPYMWQSDNTGKLAFKSVAITQLGGCYCINSSCGSSLAWTNSSILLKDLGGGAVGAIHATDASVVISNVTTDTTTISYYGQLVKKASTTAKDSVPALGAIPAVPQQQAYFSNWSQLDADKSNIALTQSNDSSTMYYQVVNGTGGNHSATAKSCSIKRNGVLSTVPVASFSDTGSSSMCIDEDLFLMIKKINDSQFSLELLDTGPGGLSEPHKNCNDNPGGDGWHVQKVITLPPQTSSYQTKLTKALYTISNVQGAGCTSGATASIDGLLNGFNTAVMVGHPCTAPGAQFPTYNWSYLFEYSTDTYQETVSDDCTSYEADSTCQLQSETVDGVITTRQFTRTGLSPLPTCKTYAGAAQPMQVCRPWWNKNRTYMCKSKQTLFDLAPTKQRFQSVISSSIDNTSSLFYTDYRDDGTGKWSSVASTITLPGRDSYDECAQACKIKRPKIDTQVGVSGVNANLRLTADSFDTFYLNCDAGVCPSQPSDVIVEACGCLNEFGEAATIMQTMRLAGADNICSSGTKIKP
jgi:hypothetical protein